MLLLPPARPLARPGGTFRALRHRNYRLYFYGQLVSLIGSWMQTTALAQLAYDEAAAYYGQALEMLGRSPGPADHAQRLELLIVLGDAQRRAADPAPFPGFSPYARSIASNSPAK